MNINIPTGAEGALNTNVALSICVAGDSIITIPPPAGLDLAELMFRDVLIKGPSDTDFS